MQLRETIKIAEAELLAATSKKTNSLQKQIRDMVGWLVVFLLMWEQEEQHKQSQDILKQHLLTLEKHNQDLQLKSLDSNLVKQLEDKLHQLNEQLQIEQEKSRQSTAEQNKLKRMVDDASVYRWNLPFNCNTYDTQQRDWQSIEEH